MKTLSILFCFLLQDVFLVTPATGIVYYVKPTSPDSVKCTGQPCHTLEYYFVNVDTKINNKQNITMILMSGTHAVMDQSVLITVPIMNMRGESQGVVMDGSGTRLCFNNFNEVYLSNITINSENWALQVKNAKVLPMSRFTMSSVTLYSSFSIETMNTSFRYDSCKFYNNFLSLINMGGANMIMENCTLNGNDYTILLGYSQLIGTNLNQSLAKSTNTLQAATLTMSSVKLYQSQLTINSEYTTGSFRFDTCELQDGSVKLHLNTASTSIKNCKLKNNSISIQYSTIVFSGVSLFTGTAQSSAISSYFSNITLSGTIVFANNSGIRGGAMALYSSTLNMAPGTNVLFVNNRAEDTGGAIYINPSLGPNNLLLITEHAIFRNTKQDEHTYPQCFYHLLNCSAGASLGTPSLLPTIQPSMEGMTFMVPP